MKNILWILIISFSLNAISQGTPLTLKNFRIENGQTSRVYFDSSEGLTGSVKSGFTISGKLISGISINSKQTTGHYITVSSGFNFWDNNTIRYEGGSNLEGVQNNALNGFTLQYIKNNLPESNSNGKVYFVSTNGSNNKSGLSESNAWSTISYAAKQAKAGDIVYIKAGDYGSENVVVSNSGTSANPIKFIGYKNEPGDNPNLKKAIGMNFDSRVMPLLKNGKGDGIDIDKRKYLIFKNIQIDNYTGDSFDAGNISFIWFDNVYLSNADRGMKVIDSKSQNNRLTNSYLGDFSNNGVRFQNRANLIANNLICSSKIVNMDYYIVIYGGPGGGGNIVLNNIVDRYGSDTHTGHGISMKVGTYGWDLKYNLIEDCTIRGVKKSLEARHFGSDYSVFRNISIERGRVSKKSNVGGIAIMNGASYNTFENITISNTGNAILVLSSTEDADAPHAGTGNLIKNCVFNNVDIVVESKEDNSKQNRIFFGNKIINCTINTSNTLLTSKLVFKNNEFINCIINDVTSEGNNNKGFTYSYCNFYDNSKFNKPVGLGNISYDPIFMDASRGNFRLKSSSKLINAGKKLDNVKSDFDGNERPQGTSQDVGAFEYQENSTSSIKADAGEDKLICLGESVTLTASGGTNYLWSNGEKTKSIKISPSSTKNYVVTVSDNSSSDIDEVIVTVIDVKANAGDDVDIYAGESVVLTATGGDSYLWSTGETKETIEVSPSNTKIYMVTVTKDGCEDSDNVVVNVTSTNPSIVIADAGEDVEICSGESVTLIASGGANYKWSTGATTKSITVSPNSNKTYTVTVTEGGISDKDEVNVTVNDVTAIAGGDVIINTGESVTLTASGGDSYLWSTGDTSRSLTIIPSSTKIYTVTVFKNSCEDTDSVQITVVSDQPSTITANAGEDQTICQGESTTLTANGGTEYYWSNGATTRSIMISPKSTKIYTVTVSDGSISDTDDVKVIVNIIKANAGKDVTINKGEKVTLTASGGDSYLWNTGETTRSIIVNPRETKRYNVTAKISDCTDKDRVWVTVVQATAAKQTTIKNRSLDEVSEQNWDYDFKVFPNPTTGNVNINIRTSLANELNLVLISLNGVVVYRDKITSSQGNLSKRLNLSGLAKGFYFVKVYNSSQNFVKKILLI